jgi:hypothetical protein
MAKSKITDSHVLAYLQERREVLQEELSKVEAALLSLGADPESPTDKKGKKKIKKKKLEKAVKATRKKISETLMEHAAAPDAGPAEVSKPTKGKKDVKAAAEAAIEALGGPSAPVPTASKGAAGGTGQRRIARRTKARQIPDATSPAKRSAPKYDPSATMDEKIKYALSKKRNSTKEQLIEYLNTLEPAYGLSKLRKVVAFRLNHLLKTGQIKGQESDAGFRYAK